VLAVSTIHPSNLPPQREHIVASASICGGEPCIAGMRIGVIDVYVWRERQGLSPDEILRR
jgi:uncharacterized protein (DUF433 family)